MNIALTQYWSAKQRSLFIELYIITQVILAFRLVVAYDLLEDRRTIDVIITKCFKMAERFENLDNILSEWAKEKIPKSLDDALNRYEKQEEEKRLFLFLENGSEKILEQSQSAVEQDQIKNNLVPKLTLR